MAISKKARIIEGNNFFKILKKEREERGLSQWSLAMASDIPVDTIRAIEQGRVPSPGLFIATSLIQGLGGQLKWIVE